MTQGRNVLNKTCAMTITLGTTLGAINDIISPMLSISNYLVILFIILLIISLFTVSIKTLELFFRKLPTPEIIKGFFANYWAAPIIIMNAALIFILSTTSFLTQKNIDDGGVISSIIPGVYEWKKDIGLIKSSLQDISLSSERTAKSAESLVAKSDNFKKEVSQDPRKEIANFGLSWSDEDFYKTISSGDIATAELYYIGGKRIKTNTNSPDTNNPIIEIIKNYDDNFKKMLEMINSFQEIDLNTFYTMSTDTATYIYMNHITNESEKRLLERNKIRNQNQKKHEEWIKEENRIALQNNKIIRETKLGDDLNFIETPKPPKTESVELEVQDIKLIEKAYITPWIAASWADNKEAMKFLEQSGVDKQINGKIIFTDGTSAQITSTKNIIF